ncbi:MAG: hypothetical protein ICV70_02740, partial [Jiangellaceae bacterium]|nr:hypothetical protein [Jiangellaceae bacterium]
MTNQAIGPGQVLAGRYRVEDLLDEVWGVRTWRAVDAVLSRPVLVQTVSADDPRAQRITDAARAAATVRDARFLRVLDVDTEDATAYVVREWPAGRDLRAVLADGPLSPDQARALAREVAEALATAHEDGLTHLRLSPASVIVTPDGGVKIAGLATDTVIYGLSQNGAAERDAAGIGRVLYAALTGRWPGDEAQDLPRAPRIDDRLASPRQVRSGVPRLLDEVADRALGYAARQHALPLRSPAEVADALTRGTAGRLGDLLGGFDDTADEGRPPAVLDDSSATAPPVGAAQSPIAAPAEAVPRRAGTLARVMGVLAGAALLLGAAVVGLQLVRGAVDTGTASGNQTTPPVTPTTTSSAPSPQPPVEPRPLAVSSVTDFDPPPAGSGDENPDEAPLAADGDTDTAWTTVDYFDPLEDQKPGVGIYLDLGATLPVSGVRLTMLSEDTGLEIRVPDQTAVRAPTDLDDWRVVASVPEAAEEAQVRFDTPVTTRFVLVWLTR